MRSRTIWRAEKEDLFLDSLWLLFSPFCCPWGYALARVTPAQLGGMFLVISMFSKTVLSRAPCFLTHSAIAEIPILREVFSRFPNTASALLWSEKAIFTSFRGSNCNARHSLPMASATTLARSLTVYGTSAPTLKIWFRAEE